MRIPKEIVRLARHKAGLTQIKAATVVRMAGRSWQRFELGESRIDATTYEFFLIKTGLIDDEELNGWLQ